MSTELPSNALRITVLVENCVRRQSLLGEHGLAYWIETDTHRILFDTGPGQTLAANARHIGVDLRTADAIALSHGHYDHSGDLHLARAAAPQARLFLHPQALIRRYSGRGAHARDIGMPSPLVQELQGASRLVWTTQPTEIVPGVFATGPIPRVTAYEDTGGAFFLDPDGRQPDPIHDDQALYIDTDPGVVVVLGCAHSGVVNTLEYILTLTRRPIHAVIGGTHLLSASPERLTQTLTALGRINPRLIAPAHCTGPRATAAIWTAFPDQTADCCVGAQWTFARHPPLPQPIPT